MAGANENICFYADINGMPDVIGSVKKFMHNDSLSFCHLGGMTDKSNEFVLKLTIGTHELPPQEMKLINMCIKEKLIPELLKQHNMPQVDIPFVSVLFLLQPLDSTKAQDVIPIQRPYQRPPTSDNPMDKMPSVSCVFAFKEGLSLLTFSHLIGDITCLDLA